MSSTNRIPFESDEQATLRNTRDAEENADVSVVGYLDDQASARGLQGTEVGPYVELVGRAAEDGALADIPAVVSGESQRVLLDQYGRILLREAPPVPGDGALIYSSAALEESAVVKASAGFIYECHMLVGLGNAADLWLHIYDLTGAPSLGSMPIWRALLPSPGATSDGEVWVSFPEPLPCANGIVVAVSTALLSFAPAGDVAAFQVEYR